MQAIQIYFGNLKKLQKKYDYHKYKLVILIITGIHLTIHHLKDNGSALMFSRMFNKFNTTTTVLKQKKIRDGLFHHFPENTIGKNGSSSGAFLEEHRETRFFEQTALESLSLTNHYDNLRQVKKMYKNEEFNKAELIVSDLVKNVKQLSCQYPQNIFVLKLLADANAWEGICLTGGGTDDAKKAISSLESALAINPSHALAKEFLMKNQLSLGQTPPGMTIIRK